MLAIANGAKLVIAGAGNNTNPQDFTSATPKVALAEVAAFWNQITQEEQTSWDDVAVGFPFKNKFGDIYTASGYQVFMKLNSNLRLINEPLLRSGPVPDFPTLPPIVPPSGDPEELLRFSFTGGIPDTIKIMVFASAPVLRGSIIRAGKKKLLGIANPNSTGVIDVTYQYQNLFGKIKPSSIMFFEFVAVSLTTGQKSVPSVVKVVRSAFSKIPKCGFYLPYIDLGTMPTDADWITPFRIYGFNLTEQLVVANENDNSGHSSISTSPDGPWVQSINVPINQAGQPSQNVFYLKNDFTAEGQVSGEVSVTYPTTGKLKVVFGGKNQNAVIGDPTATIDFGEVYRTQYTVKEVAMPYNSLVSDISWLINGANADLFQVGPTPDGPWSSQMTTEINGLGLAADFKVYVRIAPNELDTVTAVLNANSGGYVVNPYTIDATPIAGFFTSAQSGGIAVGNVGPSENTDADFTFNAAGIGGPPSISANTLVNCTVEFSEMFGGIYSNPLVVSLPGPTITGKQIFIHVLPTTFGAFSANIHINASGATQLTIPISGTAV